MAIVGSPKNFTICSDFRGYHAREDITNLPIHEPITNSPLGYLVRGSRDVLTNSANRLGVRNGYTLFGQADTSLQPIESSYDWSNHLGVENNMRSYGDKLQFLVYDSLSDTFVWTDLATGFSSVAFNYAEFWDPNETLSVLLFVNGSSNIYEWNGAVTTLASTTATTATKEGTETWAEAGFYTTGTREIVINGVAYTYTGGENTTTLTGMTAVPAVTAGDLTFQAIKTTANSSMSGIPATFKNDLISTLYNQVHIGSVTSRDVYISKEGDYTDYTFSTPRLIGEGATFTLDQNPTGFVAQEDSMYISAGKDQWYRTQYDPTTTTVEIGGVAVSQTFELLYPQRLKTNSKTAARFQGYITQNDNKVVYVNNEPAVDELGRVDNIFAIPDITNLSDVIRDDMNMYDFNSRLGDMAYWKNFLYISVPLEGIVLVWNVAKQWWEAPQNLPVGKFSIIDGELYGHSAHVPETYKLFDGFNDNGHPILAIANFAYMNFGSRYRLKSFNEYYVEGYISSNTELTFGIRYEIDGCGTETYQSLDGSDSQVVCIGGDDNSLGKHSLGKYPIGSLFTGPNQYTLPPKFRVIKTFPRYDFYEVQFSFSSYGTDQRWELIGFGPEVSLSKNEQVYIKQ